MDDEGRISVTVDMDDECTTCMVTLHMSADESLDEFLDRVRVCIVTRGRK